MEDRPVKLSKRAGTDDSGKMYEFKITALLALRCVENPKIKHAWFGSNVNNASDLDDVVMYVKDRENVRTAYLMQLKHQDYPKNIARKDFLYDAELKRKCYMDENFSVSRYQRNYFQIKKSLGRLDDDDDLITSLREADEIFYLIYTNKPLGAEYDFLQVCGDESAKLFGMISTGGFNVYGLNSEVLEFDESFSRSFKVFTEQVHVNDVDELMKKELVRIAQSVKMEPVDVSVVLRKYLDFAQTSIRGVKTGFYEALTVNDVVGQLMRFYLDDYQIKLSLRSAQQFPLLNEILQSNLFIVVEEIANNFFQSYVSAKIQEHYNVDNWNQHVSKNSVYSKVLYLKPVLMKMVGDGGLTVRNIYEALWLVKKVPLLVKAMTYRDYKRIQAALRLSRNNAHPVIVLTDGNVAASSNLNDLSDDHRKAILQHEIILQGRRGFRLGDLLNKSMYKYIKFKDIIEIISNKYQIGGAVASTLQYYIPRAISKVLFTWQDFSGIDSKFILRGIDALYFRTIFNSYDKNKAAVILGTDSNKDLKNYHELNYINKNIFELNRSCERTKPLRDHQMIQPHISDVLTSNELWTSFEEIFHQNVCVMNANPGMGKTEFFNHVALNAPTQYWVLKVTLNKHNKYYKRLKSCEKSVLDHLNYFYGDDDQELAKQVFLKFVNQKKIFVLLDGFDEILMTYKKEVTSILTSLQKNGYKVWVSTRPVTKAHLEEALDTISRTLNPLPIEDQRKFLYQYYQHLAKDESQNKTVFEFIEKLLAAASVNLSFNDNQFTGLPLQTQLLADVFKKELETILQTNCFAFNDKFDLIYLYERFLEEKNNILYQKSGDILMDMRDEFEEFQKLCALSVVFAKDVLEKLQVKNELKEYCRFFSRMHLLGRDGIVSMDPTTFDITFVHQTFAEFLAAKWLYQNWKTKDVREIISNRFKSDRDFLFSVFDRCAAKKLPLHLSIVSKNKNATIRLIKQNPKAVVELDDCGRTALHLLSCYGFRYKSYVSCAVDEMAAVFDVVPDDVVTDSKDQLLGYNALEYAICSNTFGVADKLCQKSDKLPFLLDIEKKHRIFAICEKNRYRYLFGTMCKYFARKELLSKRTKPLTSMYIFCGLKLDCKDYTAKFKSKTVLELVRNTYVGDIGFVAAFGNANEFLMLLQKGVDVNETDNDANTALHYASISNNHRNVKTLIAHENTNLNLQNKNGDTPLHLSLEHKNFAIAHGLLDENVDVNLPNQFGETAFHYSCKHANRTLVEKIFPKVTYLQNNDGETGLHLALKKQNFDVAHALIENKADVNFVNYDDACPFLYACEYGKIDLVEKMLPIVTNKNLQNKNGETALFVSLKSRKFDIAHVLIDAGVDVNLPNDFGTTSFAYACKVAHIGIVKKILATVKNINSQNRYGETALFLSIDNDNNDISLALIEAGSDINMHDGNGKTSFIYACQSGKIDLVRKILPMVANINLQDDIGDTALHKSLENKHLDLSMALIGQGADVNLTNKFGETPFLYVLKYGEDDLILDLLPSVADVNLQTWDGTTALHLSIKERKFDIAYRLIDKGADVNSTNTYGDNAFLFSCQLGKIDLVQKLLPMVTNINCQNCTGETVLLLALENKHFELAHYLLSAGVDVNLPNEKGATALHHSCKLRKLDLVEKILPKVANVDVQNVDGETALNLSLKQRRRFLPTESIDLDVARLLIKAGADVNNSAVLFDACLLNDLDFIKSILPMINNINSKNINGETPLHVSLDAQNFEIANILIDHGADVNIINHAGETAFFNLCRNGKIDIVKKVLRTVTDVNLQNFNGDTVLNLSAANRRFEVARALIKVGADVNLPNGYNTTPFFHFCKFQETDCVKNILPTITNINLQNVEGETALHLSLKNAKKFAVAHILIDQGADVNLIDNAGETVLFYACQTKRLDLVKKIIPMVKDVNQRNVVGETVLHASISNYNYDVACFLIDKGADVNLVNNFGTNAFHYACQFGKLDLVKIMIPMTYNVNLQNVDGDSALHLSLKTIDSDVVSNDKIDVANYLIDKCADDDLVNNVGATAFFYACKSQNLDVVKRMLPTVSKINLQDNDGETALHYCLKGKKFYYGIFTSEYGSVTNHRDYDIAHILIDAGADVNLTNNMGATALFYACHFKSSDFAQEILPMVAHICLRNIEGELSINVFVPNLNLEVAYAFTGSVPDLILSYDSVSKTAWNFGVSFQIINALEVENNHFTKVEGEIKFIPNYKFSLGMARPKSPTDRMDYLHLKIILYLKFVLERGINRKLRLAYVKATP